MTYNWTKHDGSMTNPFEEETLVDREDIGGYFIYGIKAGYLSWSCVKDTAYTLPPSPSEMLV